MKWLPLDGRRPPTLDTGHRRRDPPGLIDPTLSIPTMPDSDTRHAPAPMSAVSRSAGNVRSVVWFKRDLRLEDHGPLMAAAAAGSVVGLYVYEPIVYRADEHDAAHLQFINECLRELREALRGLGTDLLLRHGSMSDVLDRLHDNLPFDELWSHEETGLDATYARDRQVRAWCRRRGVRWTELLQHGVVRPLRSRDGWAGKWNRRMAEPCSEPPRVVQAPGPLRDARLEPGPLLGPSELGLPPTSLDDRQSGGSAAAGALLHSFLYERGEHYQSAMSSPLEGWDSCSRLSPHLAYGSVPLRSVFQATRQRAAELADGGSGAKDWRRSIASFEKRLRWHCHFIQKLEDEPPIEFRNFNRTFDGLRQEDPSRWTALEAERFRAWAEGRTGFPMVDASMRCLARTGWINFRMRAMLVSFAAYHLWLHWKPVATHLATRFLDFEPGIHLSQCQMQSGVTGINTVRIYSPAKQVRDQDPRGVFLRRWIPELRHVPDGHLAEPEKMPALTQRLSGCEIGHHYPAPIVDHRTAYNEARARIFAARKGPEARREAERVYQRHGSRRRPRRRS